jgi:hypothetical protein
MTWSGSNDPQKFLVQWSVCSVDVACGSECHVVCLWVDVTSRHRTGLLEYTRLGCAGFAKKKFSLQSETERNEIRFARSREKRIFFRFFSLHFASNFSLPTKAKLIERIFALFRFQTFFVSLPIFSYEINVFFALFCFEAKRK